MISLRKLREWKKTSEKYQFKTLSQFISTAVEFYINSL